MYGNEEPTKVTWAVNKGIRVWLNVALVVLAAATGYVLGISSLAQKLQGKLYNAAYNGARAILDTIPLIRGSADQWSRQIADWVVRNAYGIAPGYFDQYVNLGYFAAVLLVVAAYMANRIDWPGER